MPHALYGFIQKKKTIQLANNNLPIHAQTRTQLMHVHIKRYSMLAGAGNLSPAEYCMATGRFAIAFRLRADFAFGFLPLHLRTCDIFWEFMNVFYLSLFFHALLRVCSLHMHCLYCICICAHCRLFSDSKQGFEKCIGIALKSFPISATSARHIRK